MKRLLPFIPIILLLFLGNSCVDPSSAVATAMATQFPTPMTPTSISTSYKPELSNMISAINTDLSTASPLGWIMDAQYYVIDVTFEDNSPRKDNDGIAFVHVDCVCMNSTDCCIPERTFVVVVESMRKNRGYIPSKAFEGVGDFRVICSDLATKQEIGTMSATWNEVAAYVWDTNPDLPSKHPLRGHTVRLEK